MYWFVETVCTIAQIIFLTMLCDSFFAHRDRPTGQIVLAYALFGAPAVALAMFPRLSLVRAVYWMAAGTALVVRQYSAPLTRAGALCLAQAAVRALSGLAAGALLSFSGLRDPRLMVRGDGRIAYVIVSHLCELMVVVLVCLIRGMTTGRLKAKLLLSTYPSLAIGIMFCCLIVSEVSGKAELIALGLLYTCIVVILFTTRMQEQEDERRSLEQANRHYAMQKAYYEQLQAQQEQIRALWHDISKYLAAVQAESPASPSLQQLQDMVSAIAPVVDVDNRVVSIILNEYVQKAEGVQTAVSLDVQLPHELPVTAADLYIILGNTLDNALEACAALPPEQRRIALRLRTQGDMLFYKISNPAPPAGSLPKGGAGHGYGLRNVRECARRHRGSVQTAADDGAYTVTVLINF